MTSIDSPASVLSAWRQPGSPSRRHLLGAVIAVLGMVALLNAPAGLGASWLHGRMLALHLVLEFFAIVTALLVVTVSWHTLDLRRDAAASTMLCGFVVVASCDLMHAMTFRGMPDFVTASDPERSLFFWLMGRSVEVLTLCLLALGGVPQMSRLRSVALGLGASAVLVWIGSFHHDWLPRTFIEGIGLTPFKASFEYTLCALNIGTAWLLARRAARTGSHALRLLALSSFVTGVGELSFTAYVSMSDFQTIAGHLYKVAAYALLYRATCVTGLRAPFEALLASEAQLIENEQRLRTLSDNLPNSLVYQLVTEADGSEHFVHISASLERLNGLKVEDVMRDKTLLFGQVHPDDVPAWEVEDRRATRAMDVFEFKARMTRADGVERVMQFVSAPRALPGGRIVWDGIQSDVTEPERVAQAQRETQARLMEVQKMESIGTLASGIAHDFNNVLGAIIGNTHLARDELDRHAHAAVHHSLEQVTKAAQRARSLVRQILTFARRSEPQRQVALVRPVVEESLGLLRATLPTGIDLRSRLADLPIHASIDPTQIEQVLLNLVTNAWHAIGERPGHIEVGLATTQLDGDAAQAQGLPSGRYVNLWVSDDGCGMDAATQARLFEPFFTTKPVGIGTGLGMSVVHGIVRSHDGALRVTSALGQGTRFDLYLPLAAAPHPAPPDAEPTTGDLFGQGVQVLYVDDDEVMSVMVERLLQRAGYTVTCLPEPLSALALMRSAPGCFDLLVTDHNMPALTGLELVQALRAAGDPTRVVLTSGLLTPQLHADATALGITEVLAKENTLEALPGAVRRLLSNARV